MEFKRENPDCKFTIPDRPTVRQQFEYISLVADAVGRSMVLKYWEGAKSIIQSWECETVPDYKTFNIDESDSPTATNLLVWAGWEVRRYMNNLEDVSKN